LGDEWKMSQKGGERNVENPDYAKHSFESIERERGSKSVSPVGNGRDYILGPAEGGDQSSQIFIKGVASDRGRDNHGRCSRRTRLIYVRPGRDRLSRLYSESGKESPNRSSGGETCVLARRRDLPDLDGIKKVWD